MGGVSRAKQFWQVSIADFFRVASKYVSIKDGWLNPKLARTPMTAVVGTAAAPCSMAYVFEQTARLSEYPVVRLERRPCSQPHEDTSSDDEYYSQAPLMRHH